MAESVEKQEVLCREAIYSEEYADFIKEYYQNISSIQMNYNADCVEAISARLASMYIRGTELMYNLPDNYSFQMIPSLYGLADTASLESSGILSIHRNPYLNLRGSGVIIGVIDTGIDYQHPAFVYEDRTTKILSLWDQTIREGNGSSDMPYGTVYDAEIINQALQAETPLDVVPSEDQNGHGTFLAGIAAGRATVDQEFSGAAPDANLCVVKLKPSKQYLRDFFGVPDNAIAYQENDIMMGISYCLQIARRWKRPIVIVLGLSSNNGGHTGESYLGNLINELSENIGVAVVAAAGNEANKRRHFEGNLLPGQDYIDAEIRVAAGESIFSLEMWSLGPDLYNIGLLSPAGEWIARVLPINSRSQTIRFWLDGTEVFVHYQMIESLSGDEVIFLRFVNPSPGIWTIRISGSVVVNRRFQIWLPMEDFLMEDTYFLQSNPDITLSDAACVENCVAIGAYNHVNNSLYVSSGRGFTADDRLKPDVTAPGVNIYGPAPGGEFTVKTGTSIAAAHVAGASALLMEWGIVQRNNLAINSQHIIKYLTLGAVRKPEINYPSRLWGYGIVDIQRIFNELVNGRI